MKKMKWLALLLALLMMATMTLGCGDTQDTEDADQNEDTEQTDDTTSEESERNTTPPESTDGNVVFTFFGNLDVDSSVNWGDCSLIKLPDGEYCLVDACEGGYETHIVEQLKESGVTHIETAIISHFHSDHYGGLQSFIDAFGIKTVYIDALELDSSLSWNTNAEPLAAFIQNLEDQGLEVITVLAGDSFTLSGVEFDVLYPTKDTKSNTTNDTSIVFSVNFKGQKALYTGDLYYTGEDNCLNEVDNELLKADLLKIMHHGANTSGGSEFIETVSPKVAVAMGNHIMEDLALYRYSKVGCEVYQVWETGDTNVMFDGTDIYVWCAQ